MPTVKIWARRQPHVAVEIPEKFDGMRFVSSNFNHIPLTGDLNVKLGILNTIEAGVGGLGSEPNTTFVSSPNQGPRVPVTRGQVTVEISDAVIGTGGGGSTFHAGTLTYPDGWESVAFTMESEEFAEDATTSMRFTPPSIVLKHTRDGRIFNFTATVTRTQHSIPFDVFQAADGHEDYDITRVQLDFNGQIRDMQLESIGNNHPDPPLPWQVRATLSTTFVGDSGTPLAIRAFYRNGVATAWYYTHLYSVAEFTVDDSSSPLFVLDSADSFAPTGTIENVLWQRTQGNGTWTQGGFDPSSTDRAPEVDMSDRGDGETASIRLDLQTRYVRVDGLASNLFPPSAFFPLVPVPGGYGINEYEFVRIREVLVSSPQCGLLQHRLGPLLTAENETTGVRIKSESTTYFLDGYSSPTLYHIGNPKAGGPVGLMVQKRADRTWWIFRSNNIGRTWQAVKMVLSDEYINATRTDTIENIEVMAAIRKSDKALLVWRGEDAPVTVATLSKSAGLQLRQRDPIGSMDLVLFQASAKDQPSRKRISRNGGRTWEDMP